MAVSIRSGFGKSRKILADISGGFAKEKYCGQSLAKWAVWMKSCSHWFNVFY